MARLTIVFVVWIASTAWNEFDEPRVAELRRLVDKYERSYYSPSHADRGEDPFSRNQR